MTRQLARALRLAASLRYRTGAAGRRTLEEQPRPAPAPRPPAVSQRYPRNAPCPCGSGLKFKRCCGGARRSS